VCRRPDAHPWRRSLTSDTRLDAACSLLAYDLTSLIGLALETGSFTRATAIEPMLNFNLITTLLQVAAAVYFSVLMALNHSFNAERRYKVYDNLYAATNFFLLAKTEADEVSGLDSASTPRWALQDDLSGFDRFVKDLQDFDVVASAFTVYFLLQGFNFALLLTRIMLTVRFHKKLNFTADTMSVCGIELAHFLVVFFYMQIYFGILAHIIFGTRIADYSTLDGAIMSTMVLAFCGAYDHHGEVLHGDFLNLVRAPCCPLLPTCAALPIAKAVKAPPVRIGCGLKARALPPPVRVHQVHLGALAKHRRREPTGKSGGVPCGELRFGLLRLSACP
jgi:hypothetical protein